VAEALKAASALHFVLVSSRPSLRHAGIVRGDCNYRNHICNPKVGSIITSEWLIMLRDGHLPPNTAATCDAAVARHSNGYKQYLLEVCSCTAFLPKDQEAKAARRLS